MDDEEIFPRCFMLYASHLLLKRFMNFKVITSQFQVFCALNVMKSFLKHFHVLSCL